MKLMHIAVSLRKGDPTSNDMVAINDLLAHGATLVSVHATPRGEIHCWVIYVLDIENFDE